MILFALIAGGMCAPIASFVLGLFVGRHWPRAPTFYRQPAMLPGARLIIIEKVRDRRADISAALRGRA